MKIIVGTNSLTEAQYPAYTNHCQAWFRFGRTTTHDFIFCNPARMGIDNMRNMTAKVALEQNADYILFIDDDVLVTPDGLQRLLNCKVDIAAGDVLIRSYPFDNMFFKREGKIVRPFKDSELKGKQTITNKDGLAAVGFSFCLIKVSRLRKVNPPYFLTCGNCTEDVYFCLKAHDVDPFTSMAVNLKVACGHILGPEIINRSNKAAYIQYAKRMGYVAPKVPLIIKPTNEETQKAMLEALSVK